MNIADCYRLLGLRTGASYEDIKASYRRLARQLHPDVNPGDQKAKDRFIKVTEAYRFLLTIVEAPPAEPASPQNHASSAQPKVTVTRKPSPVQNDPHLSLADRQLKETSYEQLQLLFRKKNFPRAIALVEGLAQKFPNDLEINQWQAITYQRWGRQLIQDGQLEKARTYLKKALKIDPHNRSLWSEVERDFRRIENALQSHR
jgi:tetratricopeptide (TPR) repeat protein